MPGIYRRAVYSVNDCETDQATIEIYDIAAARAQSPGFDDLLGTPLKTAAPDNSGLTIRNRPGEKVIVRAKGQWMKDEEHNQTNVGAANPSVLQLTMYTWDLNQRGLLIDGVPKIKNNDRLLTLAHWNDDVDAIPDWSEGATRFDFTHDNRRGLFCYEVRHQHPGVRQLIAMFEFRPVQLP